MVAHRWLTEFYERLVAMIPDDLRARLEPAEVFHEVLEHRWYLSEQGGQEADIFDSARDYFSRVLAPRRNEAITTAETTAEMAALADDSPTTAEMTAVSTSEPELEP